MSEYLTTYQQVQTTKAKKRAELAAFVAMQRARKNAKIQRKQNPKVRTGLKPKSTGITQTIGEVIKTNYSVGAPQMIAPVQTGKQNEGGSEKELGLRSIYKNPVYLVLFVVVLGSLLFAFKK